MHFRCQKKTEGDMSSDLKISSNSQPRDQLRRRSVSQDEEIKFRSSCFRTCYLSHQWKTKPYFQKSDECIVWNMEVSHQTQLFWIKIGLCWLKNEKRTEIMMDIHWGIEIIISSQLESVGMKNTQMMRCCKEFKISISHQHSNRELLLRFKDLNAHVWKNCL